MKILIPTLACFALLLPVMATAIDIVDLDVNANTVPIGPDYGGVQTVMLKGTYTVTMTSNYSMGPLNMECQKAVVYALTKGHPDSWVWVVSTDGSQTLELYDESYPGNDWLTVNCFLPEASDNTGDNTGGAILTFVGPETYVVSLAGQTDTIMLYSDPGAWQSRVWECENTIWELDSTYSLGFGLACNKALLWVHTYGNPLGWLWTLSTSGQTSLPTIESNYPDDPTTNVALFLPEGSDNTGDNSGFATVTTAIPPGCSPVSTESRSWTNVKALFE